MLCAADYCFNCASDITPELLARKKIRCVLLCVRPARCGADAGRSERMAASRPLRIVLRLKRGKTAVLNQGTASAPPLCSFKHSVGEPAAEQSGECAARVREWLCLLEKNGIRARIITNSTQQAASAAAALTGVPVTHSARLPFAHGVRRALRSMDATPRETAFVGTRGFSDAVCAHMTGCRCCLAKYSAAERGVWGDAPTVLETAFAALSERRAKDER